jgi:hypothetical protein
MDKKVRVWPDGTRLLILAEEPANWARVRAPDAYIGFMPSQYLGECPLPTATPTLTPTPRPTTPSCSVIMSNKRDMTKAQWNAFKDGLEGKWTADWTGMVDSVTKGGLGFFAPGYTMTFIADGGCEVLFTLTDKDTALGYSKRQRTSVTGQVSSIGEFLGFTFYLKDNPTLSGSLGAGGPLSTPTPMALSYEGFCSYYASLTDIQKADYEKTLVGKRVRWTGVVSEVRENGRIYFQSARDCTFFWVYLDGVPLDQARGLNKGQAIQFEAQVRDTGTGLLGVGFALYLDNPVVLSIR